MAPCVDGQNNYSCFQLETAYTGETNQYKGQLHCHTTSSDGAYNASKVAEFYTNAGYDFLCITDHKYIVTKPNNTDIVFFQGIELSTVFGHTIATSIADFPASSQNPQAIVDSIKARGGLVWLSHPNAVGLGWDNQTLSEISCYDGVEVYNFITDSYAEDTWDYILSVVQKRVNAIAVDDFHGTTELDGGWVMVFSGSLGERDIFNSLKTGNFYSTQGPIIRSLSVNEATVTIRLNQASNISWIGKSGFVLKTSEGVTEDSYTSIGEEGYIRVRVENSGYAWTNPIYVTSVKTKVQFNPRIPESMENDTEFTNKPTIQPYQESPNISFFDVKIMYNAGGQTCTLPENAKITLGGVLPGIYDCKSATFLNVSSGRSQLILLIDEKQVYSEWITIKNNTTIFLDIQNAAENELVPLQTVPWFANANYLLVVFLSVIAHFFPNCLVRQAS